MPQMITYKAYYSVPNQNPFKPKGIIIPTKTVEIDASVSFEEVVRMVKDAQNPYIFNRVEYVSK